MTGLLITLAILALVGVAFLGLCLPFGDDSQERLRRTQADIDAEHRAARQAMNDAAGQSWRNLAE